jgi:hypothetical protein
MRSKEFWTEAAIVAIGFLPVVLAIWVIISVARDSEAAGTAASVFSSR